MTMTGTDKQHGKARRVFSGNGLSRTAMVFRIATIAKHKLTVPEMNRIKDINPRDSWRAPKAFRQHIAVEMAKRALKLILK